MLIWSTSCARSVAPSSVASGLPPVAEWAASSVLLSMETAAESDLVDPSAGASDVGECLVVTKDSLLAGCHG